MLKSKHLHVFVSARLAKHCPGKTAAAVKTVSTQLRESLSDFAAELVAKTNKKQTGGTNFNVPVTRPLSVGSKYNSWIHANQQELLQLALSECSFYYL